MKRHFDRQRRAFAQWVAGAAAVAAWPGTAASQTPTLNVLSHTVHKTVATGNRGPHANVPTEPVIIRKATMEK